MTYFQAIFLGVLQGVSEFLPISSSGHLFLFRNWLGLAEIPVLFDLILHLATLAAVVLVFRQTIIRLIMVLFRLFSRRAHSSEDKADLVYIAMILGATLITIVIGFSLRSLDTSTTWVYIGFFYTALLLVLSSWIAKRKNTSESLLHLPHTWRRVSLTAFVVGTLQGLAVLPGISRSGSTIGGALLCGMRRDRAGEFSFLLSIPAILGGFVLLLLDGEGILLMDQVDWSVLISSMLAAFISGYFALKLLIGLIKRMQLYYFAFYLIPLAILGLLGILG